MTAIRSAPRRLLRREDAALYVGMSASKFGQLVAEARMPAPFAIDGCVVWDVRDLDEAVDALKYGAQSEKPVMRLARI